MEREATLLVVSLALCGPLCFVFGALAPPIDRFVRSGRQAEAAAWRRLWLPLAPAAFALLLLLGWTMQEADNTDDMLDPILLLAALPGAIIGARALARGLSAAIGKYNPLAATIGLVHPKAIIDESLSIALDPDALDAVRAHEAAHVRHRDPLRIWLAQLGADLQWPARSARARFRNWLHALEVARDEEARESGTDGDALASAIVTVAQLAQGRAPACAGLIGSGELLRDRIARLLRPTVTMPYRGRALWAAMIAATVLFGLGLGVLGGDRLLRCVPGVARSTVDDHRAHVELRATDATQPLQIPRMECRRNRQRPVRNRRPKTRDFQKRPPGGRGIFSSRSPTGSAGSRRHPRRS